MPHPEHPTPPALPSLDQLASAARSALAGLEREGLPDTKGALETYIDAIEARLAIPHPAPQRLDTAPVRGLVARFGTPAERQEQGATVQALVAEAEALADAFDFQAARADLATRTLADIVANLKNKLTSGSREVATAIATSDGGPFYERFKRLEEAGRRCLKTIEAARGRGEAVDEIARNLLRKTLLLNPTADGELDVPTSFREQAVAVDYTNWRGERGTRRIVPWRVFWGANDWHPEPGWLLEAFDVEKHAPRTFALESVHAWHPPAAAE